jgi:hypothetical protein
LSSPLREAFAHLACQDARPAKAEVGGSNNGNAHLSIDVAADLAVGLILSFLLGKQGGQLLQ